MKVGVPHISWISSILFVLAPSCLAQSRSVALTFDDLLAAGTSDPAEVEFINLAILDSLDRRRAPAIGFVNEKKVQEVGPAMGSQLLKQWIHRGHDLGNHTFSHADLNELDAERFKQEVLLGESSFQAALAEAGRKPRYFRFPYNHTGDTPSKHETAMSFLAQRGYQIATCTIDNSDYLFDRAYLKMLSRKDEASAQRLRNDYLAYTAVEIDYYTDLHKQIFGRDIPHVMLLHVNRLNADVMDELLRIFEERKYSFVTLDTAQADPAFATPDTFATKYGPMWGYRWARILGVPVNGRLEPEPPVWVLEYWKESD